MTALLNWFKGLFSLKTSAVCPCSPETCTCCTACPCGGPGGH